MKLHLPPYIITVKSFFFNKKTRGMAVYPFIFTKTPNDKIHIAHEKVHLKQQLKGLFIIFYLRYAYYHLRYGYHNNPFEVEAREQSHANT